MYRVAVVALWAVMLATVVPHLLNGDVAPIVFAIVGASAIWLSYVGWRRISSGRPRHRSPGL
jgi:uncharacterized membrane-anchored protein